MEQEAAQELIVGQRGELVLVGGIAPAEGGHLAIGKGDQPMVGDGHAMGVTAQIVQHVLGATEGAFQVQCSVSMFAPSPRIGRQPAVLAKGSARISGRCQC